MRPVFYGNKIKLPRGMTSYEATLGLERMMATYKSGDLVFEEVWHNRSGGVDANEGGLIKNELQAILTGDPAKMRGIQVRCFLWHVVERRQGKRQWHNGTRWKTSATIVLNRCDKPSVKHTMTVDEVGIRFGRPHRGWPTLFASTYNRRLDASPNVPTPTGIGGCCGCRGCTRQPTPRIRWDGGPGTATTTCPPC